MTVPSSTRCSGPAALIAWRLVGRRALDLSFAASSDARASAAGACARDLVLPSVPRSRGRPHDGVGDLVDRRIR